VGGDVAGALLVVVILTDGVLAALDYLGDALSQLARVMASGGGHGNGGTAADGQHGRQEARGSLPEDR